MNAGEPLHGTFVLDRELSSPPMEVYAAFAEADRRARWVRLPGKVDPGNRYDVSLGGTEILRSTMRIGDSVERIERRTHTLQLILGRLVVFTYEAVINDQVRWVSLVSVGLRDSREQAAGTKLTWTEQYVMLVMTGDGADDVAHLRGGTGLHLNGLSVALGEGSARSATPLNGR